MNHNEAEIREIREIRERIVRIESRLVQLGDYVGANLRTKQRIDVKYGIVGASPPGWYVEVDALDVSLSRMLDEVQRLRPDFAGPLPIYHEGVMVGAVLYNPEGLPHG